MKTADWKDTSVGKIVAENFAAAKVFKKYGIDFCCHGETQLHEACAALNLDVEEVIQALQHQDSDGKGYSLCIVAARFADGLYFENTSSRYSFAGTGTDGIAGEGRTGTWRSSSRVA